MHEVSTSVLSDQPTDRELLYGGVLDLVEENAASARRWSRLVELHGRRPMGAASAWGPMTPRQQVALDVSEVWAMSDQHARTQLNIALFLSEHLPGVWAPCLSGALDRYRATTVADLIRHRLDDPADWAVVGELVTRFLRKHLRAFPEVNTEMVTCSVTQLRNRLNYEIRKIVTADEEFQRAYADRNVRTFEISDGFAQLSVDGTTDQVKLARHRLELGAKAKRAGGDPRTIAQLMADLALDLIIGKADDLPVPGFARPIINVTVPLETLAGISDDPGQLNGGALIPADLARAIATSEGATWFRLLTDPAGDPVSLSTKSYQPTATIWRYVVATQQTCAHPSCDRPAVECELDHVDPWPGGSTSVENLEPLCRLHHKAKHVGVERPDLAWEFQDAG